MHNKRETMADLESENKTLEKAKNVQVLAQGLTELYEPPLATIHAHLKELTEKQDAVSEILSSERRKLNDLQSDAMLDALLADISTIKERLNTISNSMVGLHKRVQSLQTRAANIEKVALNKANNKI